MLQILPLISLFANAAAAVFGILAAHYWLKAARTEVLPEDTPDGHGWFSAAILSENADGQAVEVVDTLLAQSRLNGRGAFWGAMAAGAVAVAQICQIVIWSMSGDV